MSPPLAIPPAPPGPQVFPPPPPPPAESEANVDALPLNPFNPPFPPAPHISTVSVVYEGTVNVYVPGVVNFFELVVEVAEGGVVLLPLTTIVTEPNEANALESVAV